jgi:hypothetical protein
MMAEKTYVEVATVNVKETFDNKFKAKLQKYLTEGIEEAVDKSSKLTTKPPKDKKAEGFYLAGSVSLKQTKKGIEAELSTALASWPGKSIFGTATSKASMEVDDPDNVSDKDVEALLDALLSSFKAKVIKELEKQAK